jgi:hypothetical protein
MRSFLLPCAPPGVPDRERAPERCNVLNVRWMAVLWTFRAPSLCRHVHPELLRSVLLDLTPITLQRRLFLTL